MNPRNRALLPAVLAAVMLTGATGALAGNPHAVAYDVKITNLTRGQIIGPPVVVAHEPSVTLFSPGQPASDELAQVAEDAVSGPLLGLLGTLPGVVDSNVADGGIPPGNSRTVRVYATPGDLISAIGMLVTTNDAFFGVRGIVAPPSGMTMTSAVAYDSGTEANNELCLYIPGPPCDNGGARFTKGAEGFIHVHAGIHGVGDLAASNSDWRNPVAGISVKRVSDGNDDEDDEDDE